MKPNQPKMKTEEKPKFPIDLGGGYKAVPLSQVTLNGIWLGDNFSGPQSSDIVLLLPSGKAAMDETGRQPYIYRDMAECVADKEVLRKIDEKEAA